MRNRRIARDRLEWAENRGNIFASGFRICYNFAQNIVYEEVGLQIFLGYKQIANLQLQIFLGYKQIPIS